ncbi:MAG: M28 family peptidase [Clostridia bacterium]|nr:M28 family peptidase [Clostridia bacterium]
MIKRIVIGVFAVILCLFFTVSVMDSSETRHETAFDQEAILNHIEKLSENGPRSIADKASNRAALEYLIAESEKYGVISGDTMEVPAYLVQEYVAEDSRYQNWYLENLIVHIPANAETPTGDAFMFMGHYDSVPMGQGSSDDGVACAVMLEAMRYTLEQMENGLTLTNDLVFCFVNGEEYGLYGSEAFMRDFTGFNNVVGRIRFGTNLESRGTSGTLIMFETAKNNYNTIKLFSEINENLFTCSIATMVYDMMPNGTDFTNFKEVYQGLNMANVGGGEDYHTQNDNPANVGLSYLSQQAQIVERIITVLADYDLDSLHDADESAIFFSYLNLTTVVYNHTAVIVFAVIGILLLAANLWLSWKSGNLIRTAKAIAAIVAGLALSAGAAYLCYYLFQYIAVLAGVIDIHMVGTITYSNTAIIVGIGILSLAVTVFTSHFACRWLKITGRDLTRAFAYVHVFLGIVLSFVLADASYLFMFSGILLMLNELLVTCVKKTDIAAYHGELLATALYFPIVIPVIVLAVTALGLTMAYVYGLVFAIAVFGIGIAISPVCGRFSVRGVMQAIRKKEITASSAEGAAHILACALILFLIVSLSRPDASVNLQGKQNIAKLPYDDALVYAVDETGAGEYRIYDLNAYGALKKYAPEMDYADGYYAGTGEKIPVDHAILSAASGNALKIRRNTEEALVYLTFTDVSAQSFTLDDGITSKTYDLSEGYSIKIHTDCTVTVNGGSASVSYREVLRDYAPLIPAEYADDEEQLHFNLWLTRIWQLGE